MIFLVNFGGVIVSKIQLIPCYIHGSLTLFFSFWCYLTHRTVVLRLYKTKYYMAKYLKIYLSAPVSFIR